ncbi:hypothetical protein PALS2_146 [Staphylococcus phage PALS_2]|nr:hypothetical protein PALS2_146 [Staphylococcus phage PALS_2]UAJ17162.1 hypothetical protein UFVDC4_00235 [Staphylococcus phage vB_SauM-UFV_DC4]BDE75541.1 hypothetical protein [Staphylococcus phage S6]
MIQLVILCLLIYFLLISLPLIVRTKLILKNLEDISIRINMIEKENRNQRKVIDKLSTFNEILLEEIKEQDKK